MNVAWKPIEQSYIIGENLFVGKWKVASVWYDGVKTVDEKWAVTFELPGLISRAKNNYAEEDGAKAVAVRLVSKWFEGCNSPCPNCGSTETVKHCASCKARIIEPKGK